MKNVFSILISDYELSDIILPETLKSFNIYFNEYDFKVWDKHMISKFIYDNFDKEVFDAFNILNGYAYKADLASYCILSKIGGWYSAITNEIVSSPPEINDKDMIVFRDIQKNSKTSWAVACQLIYSNKDNKVFDIAIKQILDNVKNKHYGETSLEITGPAVLGRSLAIAGEIKKYSIGTFTENPEKLFILEEIGRAHV